MSLQRNSSKKIFHMYSFQQLTFSNQLYPCYKCHHIGWNWLISNKFNLAPLSHTSRVREAEKRKCMMIYSGYQAGESIWAMFHPYLTQVKYICPHTSGLVWLVPHSRDFQDLSQRIRWFLRKSWSLTRMDNGCWKVEAGLGEDQFIFLFSLVMLPTLEQQLFQSSQRGPWPGLDQSEASILVTWSVLANQRPVSWSRDQGWPSCNFIPSPR